MRMPPLPCILLPHAFARPRATFLHTEHDMPAMANGVSHSQHLDASDEGTVHRNDFPSLAG